MARRKSYKRTSSGEKIKVDRSDNRKHFGVGGRDKKTGEYASSHFGRSGDKKSDVNILTDIYGGGKSGSPIVDPNISGYDLYERNTEDLLEGRIGQRQDRGAILPKIVNTYKKQKDDDFEGERELITPYGTVKGRRYNQPKKQYTSVEAPPEPYFQNLQLVSNSELKEPVSSFVKTESDYGSNPKKEYIPSRSLSRDPQAESILYQTNYGRPEDLQINRSTFPDGGAYTEIGWQPEKIIALEEEAKQLQELAHQRNLDQRQSMKLAKLKQERFKAKQARNNGMPLREYQSILKGINQQEAELLEAAEPIKTIQQQIDEISYREGNGRWFINRHGEPQFEKDDSMKAQEDEKEEYQKLVFKEINRLDKVYNRDGITKDFMQLKDEAMQNIDSYFQTETDQADAELKEAINRASIALNNPNITDEERQRLQEFINKYR